MKTSRSIGVLAALAAAAGWGCESRPTQPLASAIAPPNYHVVLGNACFRMTGGGRVDDPEGPTPTPPSKSTPDSRDFATFGFEARPNNCNTMDGSGNITWVEHNPDAIGGGFTFHGDVTRFYAVENHYDGQPDPVCGGFSGTGWAKTRDGTTYQNVVFTVDHACDEGEPGRDDHIGICIGGDAYCRAGILTGGNIQKHRLTGAAAK